MAVRSELSVERHLFPFFVGDLLDFELRGSENKISRGLFGGVGIRTSPQSTIVTSCSGLSFLPFATSSVGRSEGSLMEWV